MTHLRFLRTIFARTRVQSLNSGNPYEKGKWNFFIILKQRKYSFRLKFHCQTYLPDDFLRVDQIVSSREKSYEFFGCPYKFWKVSILTRFIWRAERAIQMFTSRARKDIDGTKRLDVGIADNSHIWSKE